MAKKKTKKRSRKKRAPARRSRSGNSHWVSMFIGLAAGLGIAAVIWYNMRAPAPIPAAAQTLEAEPETTPAKPAAKRTKPSPIEATGDGFDFYNMLPTQEVVVSDDFAQRRQADIARAPIAAIQDPGEYLIQAGSFRSATDAERMKATLGLQGMQARIIPVTVNNQRFHRVRIGPVTDLDELNEYRRRLRESAIDVLITRTP